MNNLEFNFERPVTSVLTETLPNGVEQYFIAENGIKVPGEPAFYLLSHLNHRTKWTVANG